ncbi:MAG: hypothetical protein C5B50_13685 [Verrucomicrobia bacterium]|nr:MAG: hypothetical protein C5B50_13685 [Verrucomicrobiota bacterium]
MIVALLVAAGCKSSRFGPYTSPAVTGQVIAAETKLPLASVRIIRGTLHRRPGIAGQPKGAELLMEKPPALTDRDGKFYLPSERALTIFRPTGWQFVTLSFSRPGYETFRTNLSISATNIIAGEPMIDAGNILLHPASR